MKTMPIIKIARHDHGYVIIQNKALEDTRLSWKARGLLAYLLTRPKNWEVNSEQLASISPCGPTAVRAGLRELEKAGYAELKFFGGETGGSGWIIYELPEINKTLISDSSEIKETRDSGNQRLRFSHPTKYCTENKEGAGTKEEEITFQSAMGRVPILLRDQIGKHTDFAEMVFEAWDSVDGKNGNGVSCRFEKLLKKRWGEEGEAWMLGCHPKQKKMPKNPNPQNVLTLENLK